MLLVQFRVVNSFATPNNDFLMTIDESSVAVGSAHICVIEQKHGEESIGGKVTCWGHEHENGRDEAPPDVRFHCSILSTVSIMKSLD